MIDLPSFPVHGAFRTLALTVDKVVPEKKSANRHKKEGLIEQNRSVRANYDV